MCLPQVAQQDVVAREDSRARRALQRAALARRQMRERMPGKMAGAAEFLATIGAVM